jgi:hypothetical protein
MMLEFLIWADGCTWYNHWIDGKWATETWYDPDMLVLEELLHGC